MLTGGKWTNVKFSNSMVNKKKNNEKNWIVDRELEKCIFFPDSVNS